MNVLRRVLIGLIAAGATVMSIFYFMKTYRYGNPEWKFLLLAIGMTFLLYFTFSVKSKKK